MKKIKVLALLSAVMMLLCLTFGCSFNTNNEPNDSGVNDGAEKVLKKIADNLYEITFKNDFDWNFTEQTPKSGVIYGCSGVQNGYLRGRNYDWYYNDSDICIVHAAKTEKRKHASVGVADLSFVTDGKGKTNIESIPFYTFDGINDSGVCIQVNVLPQGENGKIKFKKNDKEYIDGIFFVRYILDYAGSIEEACEIIGRMNISNLFGTKEFHWMISGPASANDKTIKTVVVEIFPEGPRITNKFINDKPILTNFNIANFDGSVKTIGKGYGFERWQILNECYDQGTTVMGMFDLMEKVYFSKSYDLFGDRFWYSEYNGENLSATYEPIELMGVIGEDKYNDMMSKNGMILYSPDLFDGAIKVNGDINLTGVIAPVALKKIQRYYEQKVNDELLITIHTSVYDLENLTLDISVREAHDHLHFTIE